MTALIATTAYSGPHDYQVVHDTVYRYASQVSIGQHYAHLTPRHTAVQEVLWHALEFQPAPDEVIKSRDYYGNHCQTVLIQQAHGCLLVRAATLVRITAREVSTADAVQAWECALQSAATAPEALEVIDMRLASPLAPVLDETRDYAARFLTPGRSWLEALLDLARHINTEFIYDPEATRVDTPLADVLKIKRGVCQDFAHLMLSCLRSHKLPARYVSGYLLNEPPPGTPKLVGSDASHAWVESWLPGHGWVGFDPTNGKLADHEFITIGWGRDYADIAPLRGVVLGGGEHELEVSVTVSRIGAGMDESAVAAYSSPKPQREGMA
jgi:transglutaminase-like putative cysteine protease